MEVRWVPRPAPLPPEAALGAGPVAERLVLRLLQYPDEALSRLMGVAGPGVVVLCAQDPQDLPWVDGLVYLGRDPSAPALYIPTTLRPSVPLPLVERALLGRLPPGSAPIAVSPRTSQLVALGSARPLQRERLGVL
jgi:hypothetical protein